MKTVRRAISRRAPALVRPGTYAVTYGVGYNEVQDGDAVGCVISSEPYNVTVAEATPALSAERGPTTLTAGDEYTLAPTYTDTVGDHVVSDFSVDWGDGTTNVYEEYIPAELTHTYNSAGEYEPSLHVTAFKDDGGIDGTSDPVDVADPTVGITAGGTPTAYEDGQVPYDFAVTRSNYSDQPMTVGLNIDGSLPSSAYVATDSDGRILDGSVTIPAGANEADVIAYPLEDHTPRWTETVDVTLTGGSSDYAIDDDNSAAGCYVENDDLYAWLDNGSDNNIFEGGDPADGGTLVPLVLDLPDEERNGAQITLTDNAPTEADVYTMSDPGDDDTPILGNVGGTYVNSVTWTYGVDEDAPSGLTTLYVEGISGSASVNDISFGLSDNDAAATAPSLPQYSPPSPPGSPPPPAPPPPVTSPGTNTNGAADRKITLSFLTPAGANGNTVIVGQEIALSASLKDPRNPAGKFPADTTFSWSVPGQTVGGYQESVDSGATSPTPTATNYPGIIFYWLDASDTGNPNQGVNRKISVTAAGLTASTTFTVESPVASVTATIGTVQVGNNLGGVATVGKVELMAPNGGIGAGITFKRTTSAIPTGFGGDWDWLQVESSTYTLTGNNGTTYNKKHDFWVLDAGKPSPGGNPINDPWHYTAENQLGTGDSPLNGGDSVNLASFGFDITADMYLMFKPDLAHSIEVPIRVVPWYAGGSATWNAAAAGGKGAWIQLTGYATPVASDQLTHSPPEWNKLNKHRYNPALPPGF